MTGLGGKQEKRLNGIRNTPWSLKKVPAMCNQRAGSSELKTFKVALAGRLSWSEHCPTHQKVVSSIPGQDTYLDCRFDLQSGCMQEATDQGFSSMSMSVCLSISLSLSLLSLSNQ